MRHLFFLLILLMISLPSRAQKAGTEYADLFDLYIMDDHEKCLKKALKYTEAEKTKRDADPWLYVTIAYYKISQNKDLSEKYPDALEEALKAGYKFRRKDKSGEHWAANQEFFDELKAYVADKYTRECESGEYKEATKKYKRLIKVDESDFGIQIMMGVSYVLANKMEGLGMIETALDSLKSKYDGKQWEGNRQKEELLAKAFINYSILLAKVDMEECRSLAKAIIETGKNIMKNNEEVQRQYARTVRDTKDG